MHRGTLAAVEHTALQEGGVRRQPHFAAQRVDFPHQMPLGGAADGGVTGHIADPVQIDGENRRGAAQPRRRQTRLNTRVSRADNRHLIFRFQKGHCDPSFSFCFAPARRAFSRQFSLLFAEKTGDFPPIFCNFCHFVSFLGEIGNIFKFSPVLSTFPP